MIKERCLKILATISERAVKRSNGTTSEFGMYQPKRTNNKSRENIVEGKKGNGF